MQAPIVAGKMASASPTPQRSSTGVVTSVWVANPPIEATARSTDAVSYTHLDEALHSDFFGYGVAPPIAEALIAAYVTASVPVCGGYFNFLLRRDVASALRPLGTVVTEP